MKLIEILVTDTRKLKNKSGNTIIIKSKYQPKGKFYYYDIYVNNKIIEKNKYNFKKIATRHDAGEFDAYFK